MKNVMTRAWEIAREAAGKFGGKAREYLGAALRQAWVESRKVDKVMAKFEYDAYNSRRYSRPWGAIVTFEAGRPKYDFKAGSYLGSDEGGTLYVSCKPGQIIAVGQRDGRGGNTQNEWMYVEADGSLRKVKRAEALELTA